MSVIRNPLATALLALCLVIGMTPARAQSILPLRSEEATLLIGVDSARTSVVTMVAVPESRGHGGPMRRLIGTGVVLSPHRLLTTASLAVGGGTFSVLLGDGLKRDVRLRGIDRQSNVALFSVEGPPLTPLRQASPQSVAAGSWVAVISNVNVTRPQIALGQVIGRGERVDFPYAGDIVEIECSLYQGASGGAVLNETGEWAAMVVGRVANPSDSAPVADPNEGAHRQRSDLLIALPVDQLQRVADDLERYGSVRRAFLGIQMRRGILADSLGVLVEGVVPKSAAEHAGLQAGDRILAFEGTPVHSSEEITSIVRTMKPGDAVEMTVSRGPDIFPLHATLDGAARPPAMPPPSGAREEELQGLKKNLDRIEAEKKKVQDQIKSIEDHPQQP